MPVTVTMLQGSPVPTPAMWAQSAAGARAARGPASGTPARLAAAAGRSPVAAAAAAPAPAAAPTPAQPGPLRRRRRRLAARPPAALPAGGSGSSDAEAQLASEFAQIVNEQGLPEGLLRDRRPTHMLSPIACIAAQMNALQVGAWRLHLAGRATLLARALPTHRLPAHPPCSAAQQLPRGGCGGADRVHVLAAAGGRRPAERAGEESGSGVARAFGPAPLAPKAGRQAALRPCACTLPCTPRSSPQAATPPPAPACLARRLRRRGCGRGRHERNGCPCQTSPTSCTRRPTRRCSAATAGG